MASLAMGADVRPEPIFLKNDLSQDYNCNGVEVISEEAIDLNDPLCLSQTDANGAPWPNADYYIGYQSFGCR